MDVDNVVYPHEVQPHEGSYGRVSHRANVGDCELRLYRTDDHLLVLEITKACSGRLQMSNLVWLWPVLKQDDMVRMLAEYWHLDIAQAITAMAVRMWDLVGVTPGVHPQQVDQEVG